MIFNSEFKTKKVKISNIHRITNKFDHELVYHLDGKILKKHRMDVSFYFEISLT